MAVRRTSGTGDQQARRTSGSSGQGARRISGAGDGVCLYVGNGSATLTIYGYRHWMEFLKCNEMPLSDEDIDALESAASCRNYSIEGTIKVNWPVVTVEFEMEKFLGKPSARNPRILSASRNFAKTMHPFAFRKEWIRGFGGKDTKRVEEGFHWVFEQDKEAFTYSGHIKKGAEIFVTFEFDYDIEHHGLW